jgi:hypothetical protein
MKLVTTILCPSRKVIEKKYGTCPKPVLFSGYSHDENTLSTLLNHIPEIYATNKDNIYLVILANIEGVMDIFNRGKRSNLKDWFQQNNVLQTYDLLRIGVDRKFSVRNDAFKKSTINTISDNLFFISAKDFSFSNSIKSFLPNVLSSSNNIKDIISYFYKNPEQKYLNDIETARKELKVKCPNLDKNAIEEQTIYIRYAFRRAIGIFLEAIHKYFKTNEIIIESAFEPQSLDIFHSTFNKRQIQTFHSISKLRNRIILPNKNVIIASQLALSFPIPNIKARGLLDTLKIHDTVTDNNSNLQRANKIRITQLIIVNMFFGLDIKKIIEVSSFTNKLKTTKAVVIASQSGFFIASSFMLKEFEKYEYEINSPSVFFYLLKNILGDFNFYKYPCDLFYWNEVINKSSTSITVQTVAIQDSKGLGYYINDLKIKLLMQLFAYDELFKASSAPNGFDLHNDNLVLCTDIQTTLNIDFFEKIMKTPDEVLFSIFDINKNEYSLKNKILCSSRFIETYFNQTIAKQLHNEFIEKIGYNETESLFV